MVASETIGAFPANPEESGPSLEATGTPIPVQPDTDPVISEPAHEQSPRTTQSIPAQVQEGPTPLPEEPKRRTFTEQEKIDRERIFVIAHDMFARQRKAAETMIRIVNIRALSAVGLSASNRVIQLRNIPLDHEDPH